METCTEEFKSKVDSLDKEIRGKRSYSKVYARGILIGVILFCFYLFKLLENSVFIVDQTAIVKTLFSGMVLLFVLALGTLISFALIVFQTTKTLSFKDRVEYLEKKIEKAKKDFTNSKDVLGAIQENELQNINHLKDQLEKNLELTNENALS